MSDTDNSNTAEEIIAEAEAAAKAAAAEPKPKRKPRSDTRGTKIKGAQSGARGSYKWKLRAYAGRNSAGKPVYVYRNEQFIGTSYEAGVALARPRRPNRRQGSRSLERGSQRVAEHDAR